MISPKHVVLIIALLSISTGWAGQVFETQDPDTGETTVTLKQDNTVVQASTRGANVFSINVEGVEFLVNQPRNKNSRGMGYGIPVMYPTPNRLWQAAFLHNGKRIRFEPNSGEHRIHGLVGDQSWKILRTGADDRSAQVTFALNFAEGSDRFQQFPFVHRLLLEVEVSASRVRMQYTVDNTSGVSDVPFGFGLHPYFLHQEERDQTFLTIPATHLMDAENMFPTGKLIPAAQLDYPLGKPFPIGDRKFDHAFFRESGESTALVEFRGVHREIRICQSDDFTHMVVWTPDAPHFSVENQTSSINAPNLAAAGHAKEAHWQTCPPGESRSGWVEYTFSACGDVGGVPAGGSSVLSGPVRN